MMIKLVCLNKDTCGFSYQVTEKELREYSQYHSHCFLCGSKLEVAKESIKETVKTDLEKQINERLDQYIKEMGLEGCWELLQRNKDYPITRLFIEEFRRRLNVK